MCVCVCVCVATWSERNSLSETAASFFELQSSRLNVRICGQKRIRELIVDFFNISNVSTCLQNKTMLIFSSFLLHIFVKCWGDVIGTFYLLLIHSEVLPQARKQT